MEHEILVERLRRDPIRTGFWYRHVDGYEVHEYVARGHVWRDHDKCVFCSLRYRDAVDPSWEKCPNRPAE